MSSNNNNWVNNYLITKLKDATQMGQYLNHLPIEAVANSDIIYRSSDDTFLVFTRPYKSEMVDGQKVDDIYKDALKTIFGYDEIPENIR